MLRADPGCLDVLRGKTPWVLRGVSGGVTDDEAAGPPPQTPLSRFDSHGLGPGGALAAFDRGYFPAQFAGTAVSRPISGEGVLMSEAKAYQSYVRDCPVLRNINDPNN